MKLNLFFYLLLFIPSLIFSQTKTNFEGIIKYDIKYISHDTSKVSEYLGNEAIVYIKQGNYKQEYPYTMWIKSIIYRQDDNKYYYFFNNTDTIQVQDCSFQDDTIINISKSTNTTEISKTICKSIIFYYKTSTVTFFYDENLYLDPNLFSKHKYSCYDQYAKETKSVYLKIIISDKKSDFIMTAKEINRTKINDNIFDILN